MTDKLLPCPFCGGENIEYNYDGSSDWTFECQSCSTSLNMWVRIPMEKWDDLGGEHGEAIRRWNTRSHPNLDSPEVLEAVANAIGRADFDERRDFQIFGKMAQAAINAIKKMGAEPQNNY